MRLTSTASDGARNHWPSICCPLSASVHFVLRGGKKATAKKAT